MAIGPVEYIVVAFPGNKFKGEIAPALNDLVEAGTHPGFSISRW